MGINYISNEELYEEFCKWEQPRDPSNIPEFIAKAIMQIADNLAKAGNFRGYPDIQDWKSDAIYMCLRGAKYFDETKYKNPFSYLTQICYNTFRGNITKEHNRLQMLYDYRNMVDTGEFYEVTECTEDSYDTLDKKVSKQMLNTKTYEKKKKVKKNPTEDLFI